MKISIIYVNYNTDELLRASLTSLKKNFHSTGYEVIVVDNASASFDETAVKKIFPSAQVIKSPENLGFGKANNLAAKQAKGEYLWLLNTDTVIPPDNNLNMVIDFLDTHTSYGAASPQLILGNGKPQSTQVANFPSVTRQIMQKIAPGSNFAMHYLPTSTTDVPCMAAAAIFLRKSAFDAVGGFAPDYFMYFEDTDLWRKFRRAGQKIRFIPAARVTHLESQSIKNRAKSKEIYYASQDIYYQHWKAFPSRLMLKTIRSIVGLKNLLIPKDKL